jgi:hypothetical protein
MKSGPSTIVDSGAIGYQCKDDSGTEKALKFA